MMTGDKYNMKFGKGSVCRLCVHESSHLIDIFKHDNKRNPDHISKYIHRYFDVDIKQDDPNSKFICGACWCLLDLIIKKRNEFKENDRKFYDTPSGKKLVLPQITGHPELLLSDSVKQIFAENSRIKLPAKYFLINFDAKVDLSTCKLSLDLVKKSPENGKSNTCICFALKQKRFDRKHIIPCRKENEQVIQNLEELRKQNNVKILRDPRISGMDPLVLVQTKNPSLKERYSVDHLT